MLTIEYGFPFAEPEYITLYVEDYLPYKVTHDCNIQTVTASDEELEYIKRVYSNIPSVENNNARCKWSGIIAQFIVDNWEWQ